ncbi:hypothetical protein GZ77_20495 [Endozoicomonas montiporae]|uniref:Phage gp6-like head-tail connector protein n=2 Tax=Endozoicomonas montiporae TaxID=1027273 RepID=A0A081N308_9GAMM|nr:head-tail connector protein [Endozoicomonas montiporae]AMO58117.1 hypothetical protein EZMO1_4193 [Endozoicomonas montiporae CL-33]KEQ12831.1 hypothetical protein GZ77_20495 [Endozoicomonas montiporae]
MQFLTLDQIKQQLRIELDNTDEDSYLELIGSAAESAVESYLNRSLYADEVPDDDSTGLVIKNHIQMAMLLIVTDFHENRCDTAEQTERTVPPLAERLLSAHRIINL